MRSTIIILFACCLAIVQASTWRGNQDWEESKALRELTHSEMWPSDVAYYPEAYILMHKVEKRLERLPVYNIKLQKRVVEFVSDQLRSCKSGSSMDKHCVNHLIGYAMSFINNQEQEQHTLLLHI